MQRKFTDQEKVVIRNKYNQEPLFNVAEVTCNFFDNRLQAFVVWPEDIFNEAAFVIDEIKENGDEYIPKIPSLWKNIYPRFREYDRTIPDDQIKLATSIVLNIAAVTLHLSNDEVHQYMGRQLLGVISLNYKDKWEEVINELGAVCNYLSTPLRTWINDYMQLDNEQYLSDEIDELFAPKPKQKKKKVEEESFTPNFMTFTKNVTNYNITLLYQEMRKANWIAEGEPDNFSALFNGGTSEAKIVWTNKVGRDNLYALFKMMVDERIISVPNAHSVQKIVESHFVDMNGKYLTGIDGGKHSEKAMALINAWKLVLKAKAPNND